MSHVATPPHVAPRAATDVLLDYQWTPQPAAAAWLRQIAAVVLAELPWARDFAGRLFRESGVRFHDLIDTVFLAEGDPHLEGALAAGWERQGASGSRAIYDQPRGLFPTIAVGKPAAGVAVELKVESVADFLAANHLTCAIDGRPLAAYRRAVVAAGEQTALGVAERHGTRRLRDRRRPGRR